jgi:glutaconate CoA-transferase subunit B
VLRPEPDTCELVMMSLHPGVTRESCVAATGWPLRFAEKLGETDPPTSLELQTLRELQAA